MLEEEVRAFKATAATKLQQMEMSQLREREAAMRKRRANLSCS